MLVHRMVKKVKNSKVMTKIRMKDSDIDWKGMLVKDDGPDYYTAITTLARIANNPRAGKYELMNQLLPIMQANKVDFDKGKFEQAWREFSKAGMSKGIFDADPRGYKVTDQIIKGFMIYKSYKPGIFTAKNENGKEFEGTMEQIKKQIDDYWVKQDEDVMKQKVRDDRKVYAEDLEDVKIIQGEYAGKKGIVLGVTTHGNYKQSVSIRLKNGQVLRQVPVHYVIADSKTKDAITKEQIKSYMNQLYKMPKDELIQEYKRVNRVGSPEGNNKDVLISSLLEAKFGKGYDKILFAKDSKTKDASVGARGWLQGKRFKVYAISGDEYSILFDDGTKQVLKLTDLKDVKWENNGQATSDSKPKHPRWRIKDDKLFRLRSAVKDIRRRVKDEEGLSRGDKVKQKSSGKTGTIVQIVPNGYEVKWDDGGVTFSGYNLVVKDVYSKGSVDRKTKDDDKSDELKMMIQQMGKVEGIRAFAKKYPEYVPQFASYFKKKVEERGGSKDGGPGSGQKGHKTAQFADPTTHKERRKTLADLKLYFNKAVKSGNRKEAVKISNRMAHLTSLHLKDSKDKYTEDPLTKKGNKILAKMRERYGKKKGESVFYASKNKGTIAGVDGKVKDGHKYDPNFIRQIAEDFEKKNISDTDCQRAHKMAVRTEQNGLGSYYDALKEFFKN